jgi:hypothetical protein
VFDRESGVMKARLTGIANVVHDIKYSADGKYIGVASQVGIRIYRSSDFSLVAVDETYPRECHFVCFYSSSDLISTCSDGYVRIYDLRQLTNAEHAGNLSPTVIKEAPSGTNPWGCAISPDGSRIAIGYYDSRNIDILAGVNSVDPLKYLFTADGTGIDSLSNVGYAVAWSTDGNTLYAGGSYWQPLLTSYPLRKWSEKGHGTYVDVSIGTSSLGQIVPLSSDKIAIAEIGTSFGVIDTGGAKIWYQESLIADFRNYVSGFLTSYDGSAVQFSYTLYGNDPALFSLKTRSLDTIGFAQAEVLQKPLINSKILNVSNWRNSRSPMLDSTRIVLSEYEDNRCLAISPDKESFVLGTVYYLRMYDFMGNLRWKISPPGPALAVNLSGNNKVALAAMGDGTIRWYRVWDGKELLAFFPHADRKRWVCWTPSGYYDVSPGGEDLIGWHVNSGKDSPADFFPVSKFRSSFYRPDIIARILSTVDESEALRLANLESGKTLQEKSIFELFPPIVSIVTPHDSAEVSSTTVNIKYSIRNLSRVPVTALKVLIDGRPAPAERGVKLEKEQRNENELELVIPEKDCEVSLIAENQYTTSDPAKVKFVWRGKQVEGFSMQPNLYVLSIGVSRYQDERIRLGFASKDAQDFAQTMMKQKGILYHDVITKVLSDSLATKDAILDGLQWIKQQAKREDIAMIFMAGHGVNEENEHFYFLPVDVDLDHVVRSGLDFTQFKGIVSDLVSKVVVFIDACHAANIFGGRRDINAVVNQLASAENGIVVFSSSAGNQSSLEDPKWNNGAFTKALVEGLNGAADLLQEGKITTSMLDVYIGKHVKDLTDRKQTPVMMRPSSIPDFPIAAK